MQPREDKEAVTRKVMKHIQLMRDNYLALVLELGLEERGSQTNLRELLSKTKDSDEHVAKPQERAIQRADELAQEMQRQYRESSDVNAVFLLYAQKCLQGYKSYLSSEARKAGVTTRMELQEKTPVLAEKTRAANRLIRIIETGYPQPDQSQERPVLSTAKKLQAFQKEFARATPVLEQARERVGWRVAKWIAFGIGCVASAGILGFFADKLMGVKGESVVSAIKYDDKPSNAEVLVKRPRA